MTLVPAHALHALEPLLFAPAFAVMLIAIVRYHRERQGLQREITAKRTRPASDHRGYALTPRSED